MGKTVVIANQKGGVGKTTTTVNLAAYLASKGKKTLMIDIDPQGNSCSGLGIGMKDREGAGIYEALLGEKQLQDVIIPSRYENLDIVPVTLDLAGAQMELMDKHRKEFILKELISPVKENYDYVLIDTPPSLGLFTLNGLVAAESVLIPLQSEFYAMEGITQLLKAVKLVKSGPNKSLQIEGVLITMYDSRTKLSQEVVENVREYFKETMFETIIPRNVRLSEAPSQEQAIFEYDGRSSGAEAYTAFGDEFLKRNGESAE